MKKLFTSICFIAALAISSNAQTVIISTGTAGTPAYNAGPVYRSAAASAFDASRYSYLYTATELAAAGITAGAVINLVGWVKNNTATSLGVGGIFRIFMKNTSTADFSLASETWANLNTGAVLVYENLTQVIPATAAPDYIDFPLTTSFTYTGGSLEISTEWDINQVAGNPSTGTFDWLWSTVVDRIYGSGNTTLAPITTLSSTTNSISTIDNRRPFIKITYSGGTTGIDVGAQSLVAPAVSANNCYTSSESVTIRIRNYSTNPIDFSVNPATITTNVTGAVTQTLTGIVNTGTLAPAATLDVPMSATLNMNATGIYTFNAFTTVAGDVTPANNAMTAVNITKAVLAAGTASASPPSYCVTPGTPTLSTAGAAGYGSLQWQESTTPGVGFTDIPGATTSPYTLSGPIAQTMYYRLRASCNGNTVTSNETSVTLNNPQITGTTPGASCGPGPVPVSLAATGTGAVLNWYNVPSGGTPIGTGSPFTTPPISINTTYYVTSGSGGGITNLGLPARLATASSGAGTTNFGLVFDALSPFILNSVVVYPVAAAAGTPGTVTIDVVSSTGAVLNTATVNVVGNPVASATAQTVILNFNIAAGTNLKLRPGARTGISGLLFEPSAPAPGGNYGYPFVIPGVVSVNHSTLTAPPTNTARLDLYYYFYNWEVVTGCESARTAVLATVTTPPAATISYAGSPYCSNAGTATVTQTGTAGGTYSSTAGLSINPATGAVTLGTSTPGTYTVTYSIAASGGCPLFTTTTSITVNNCGGNADLAITKTDGVVTYTPGGSTTYTIVASNAGPDAVTGATVADNFPVAITSVAWTATYAGGATGPAAGAGNINALVNLPVGGSATFTAVCNISGAATGNLVNTATVTVPGGITDPNAGNNAATDTDTEATANVTVSATAGTPGPTPYTTVKLAFDAINAGTHQGAIIVNVNANTDEGATPAVLNSTGTGAAVYTSVLVQPTADNITVTGSATPASRGVIELNGADNVTINGDNPNTAGTNRNLTLTLTTTNAAVLIWLKTAGAADGCLNNTIRNTNMTGQGTYTTIAGILAGSGAIFGNPAQAASNNIIIQNNAVKRLQNGIYENGFGTTPFDINWQVRDNIFGSAVVAEKLGFRGMILINASGYVIDNNTISGINSSTTTTSTMTGIQLATGNLNGTISNNKISDIKHNNTTGWGSNGIWLNATTPASNTNVFNNFVSDIASAGFNGNTPTDNGYGIVASGGSGYNIYYNTVSMNTNQPNATGRAAAFLTTTGVTAANALNVRNNIFSNSQTAGAQRYSVFSGSTAATFQDINYNDYYTASGANLGNIGAVDRANLAAWRTGTGRDVNAVSAAPVFVSPTDLHLAAAGNCALEATATPIAAITTDIDGAARNATTPDIGADEFIAAGPSATISYPGTPYCSTVSSAPVTRTGTAGGTYSAAPAGLTIDPATGTVNPSTSTPGTYTVTYTVSGGGCGSFTTTTTITITQAPNMIIIYLGSPYCSNAGTATVSQFGTPGGTYSAAPAGLTINATTGAVALGSSTPGTYTVTYTVAASGGCGVTITTTTITITAAPAATISYAGNPFCQNAGTANVTRTGTAGGTYSSTAGLVINATTGAVTLGSSTPGTYTVTYTIPASGGCGIFTTTTSITITVLPAATISYSGSPYCANAGVASVTRTGTAGGTYSSTAGLVINATTGDVTLATSTPGTYTVTYTIAAGGGCPAVTATTTITITALPAATITYAGNPFCQNAGTANVTRTGAAGGTYSAAPAGLTINATTGAVTLGTSTPGTYTVTYTIAAGSGCPVVNATTSITVSSLSVAPTGISALPLLICGPTTVTLSVTGGSLGTGATWRWYSGTCGGTLVGTGATITIPVSATTTYFVRAEGTCNISACASVVVTVNAQPTISIAAPVTSLMPFMTATLTATVTPADPTNTIVWFRNGSIVPGANGLTLVVGVDALGVYTARTATTAGCTALSNALVIKDTLSNRLFITPNPNNGLFKVRYYSSATQLGFRHLVMFNSNGQKVYDQLFGMTAPYSSMDVNAKHLAKGMYVVMITDASNNKVLATGQVVIQ